MKTHITKIFISVISVLLLTSNVEADKARIIENFGKIPLSFTINDGQYDPQVKFSTRGSGCTMFFTQEGTTFLLSRESEASASKRAAMKSVAYAGDPTNMLKDTTEFESFALKLKFLDANPNPSVTGEDRLPGNSNFFIGNDSSKWRTDVANYEKVRFSNLYDGIDLVYYGNNSSVKYDFIVKPGEDYSQILLTYDLGENVPDGSLTVNENGEMIVSTPLGNIIERKPICYQIIDGKKVDVEISYKIVDNSLNTFTFDIGEYDSEHSLVIDPEIVFSTIIGGSDYEAVQSISYDIHGNIYVGGNTGSSDFPFSTGEIILEEYQHLLYIMKFDKIGKILLYDTYMEIVSFGDLCLDNFGDLYVAGHGKEINGVNVFKINESGNEILYTFQLSGSDNEHLHRMKIDKNGIGYITGYTASPDFPITQNAYDTTHNGEDDIFITKFDISNGNILYSSFIGGSDDEESHDLAIDNNGDIYLAGTVHSNDFPVSPQAFDTSYNGNIDSFVLKLNAKGDSLLYSTYIGGDSSDFIHSIDIDKNGNVYATGNFYAQLSTALFNFPVTNEAYDKIHNESGEAFVLKLNSSGRNLVFSTYLGRSGSDGGISLVLDKNEDIYIAGTTNSTDFPVTYDAIDSMFNGVYDIFLAKLSNSGNNLEYATFIGGNGNDGVMDMCMDSIGNIFMAGRTSSIDFPTNSDVFDESFNGYYDGFIAKFSPEFDGTITVTSPNGYENLISGTIKNITWDSQSIRDIKIEYSPDNGLNWCTIVDNYPSNGLYIWTIPDTPSSKCLIRITNVSNTEISDESDREFSIIEDTGSIPGETDRIWTTYTGNLLSNNIFSVAVEDNNIWCGTERGVVKWDKSDDTYIKYTNADGLTVNQVRAVAIDNDGAKWFGTYNGVSKYDGINWINKEKINSGSGNSYSNIRFITVDNSGDVWFATDYGAVNYDGTTWTTYTEDNGLPGDNVSAIGIENDGDIWFCIRKNSSLNQNGVVHYDGYTMTNYTYRDGLAGYSIEAMVIDKNNVKWFATREVRDYDKNAISRLDDVSWTTYTTEDGLVNEYVNNIAVDENNAKWFATWGGVSVYNDTTWKSFTEKDGLAGNYVNSVAIDSDNEKWFGTSSGLSRFDGSTFRTYEVDDGPSHDFIDDIAVDNNGIMWFATRKEYYGGGYGVTSYDGYSWTNFTTNDGLADNDVSSIEVDRENNIWFATKKGASKFDGSSWKTYSTSDGLAGDYVV